MFGTRLDGRSRQLKLVLDRIRDLILISGPGPGTVNAKSTDSLCEAAIERVGFAI